MALAAAVFAVCFKGGPLSLTATAAYYSAGLLYEWLHYVVHTRWVPPAGLVGNWLRALMWVRPSGTSGPFMEQAPPTFDKEIEHVICHHHSSNSSMASPVT
eukprot:gene10515-10675_t